MSTSKHFNLFKKKKSTIKTVICSVITCMYLLMSKWNQAVAAQWGKVIISLSEQSNDNSTMHIMDAYQLNGTSRFINLVNIWQ